MKPSYPRIWIASYLIALALVPVVAILCSRYFAVSAWGVGVVLFIFAPLVPMCTGHLAWRRESRRAQDEMRGICLRCGYSRKGLDEGALCPECGARV